MSYRVEYTPAAGRALQRIVRKDQQAAKRIKEGIAKLSDEPRPRGVVPVKGKPNTLRLKIGRYRVLYQVHDDKMLVLIVDIGHRKNVYEDKS